MTAIDLKKKIDEVKAKTGSSKVDLIGHSMGGLVARQYIESDAYAGDVDQLIFLATPQLGSPKAYMMWEAGEFGTKLFDRHFEEFFILFSKFDNTNVNFSTILLEKISDFFEILCSDDECAAYDFTMRDVV